MKYIIPGMLCMFLAFACKKSTQENTTAPNVSSAILDSSFSYSTGPKEIIFYAMKFHYDDQGRFTGIYTTLTDSTVDHISADPDTTTLTLTYNGSDSMPSGYSYLDPREPYPYGAPGPSHLIYDSQGRIVVDSAQNAMYSAHFKYGNGYISWTSHYTSGDTVFIDNGNVSRYYDQFNGQTIYSYSSYPNPYYLPQLPGFTGVDLFNDGFGLDLVSKNLFSKIVHDGYSKTYNYSWTLNADGQVISGIGTDQNTGLPVEYYRFVYKK